MRRWQKPGPVKLETISRRSGLFSGCRRADRRGERAFDPGRRSASFLLASPNSKRQNCAGDHIRLLGDRGGCHWDIGELEAAMNISTHDVQRAHRGGLNQVLANWWQQLRSRHELESLDDTILRDIGLSRRAERFESSKPFWVN
jgi:uncharacterized protein YjiS (DUF1127 family)